MTFDNLWAGWRSSYLEAITDAPPGADEATAVLRPPPPGEGSLFERILTLDDEDGYIVHRGVRAAVLLNAYPYTNGHVLVLPTRAATTLSALDAATHTELWELVRQAVTALEVAYRCDGVNVGMNLGKAAGAGVPEHLHVHVLPRWNGDTNFMTTVANTRVMPESLVSTWQKLRAAWPSP